MQWPELWRLLFGYSLDDQVVRNSEEWLTAQFGHRTDRNWENVELTTAMNAYAETKRKDGYKARPPTMPELKTIIIRNRWQHGIKEPIFGEECGLCGGSGLILVWPEAIDPPWTWESLTGEYQRTTPCVCWAGKKIQKFQQFEHEISELGKRQNQARLNSCEILNQSLRVSLPCPEKGNSGN